MSEFSPFVTPDLSMLCASSQEQVIRKFLPVELIPNDWSCQPKSLIENIQSLYVKSNKRIQMYGSPELLMNRLIGFMSFPGSQQFFQISGSICYKTYLSVFQSLRNTAYIYKKNVYDLLSEYIPKIETLAPLQKLGHTLVTYYLRAQMNKLVTSHEIVTVSGEFLRELVAKKQLLEMIMESGEWEKPTNSLAFDSENDSEVLNVITNLFAEFGTNMETALQETINKVTTDVSVKNVFHYKKLLTWLFINIRSFADLINDYKMMTFPRSETVDSIPASKIPVRLFEFGQEKVVMSHELLHAIKLEKLDVSGFEQKILAMPKLSAMNFREVFEMVPSNIFKMLEFVRVPSRTDPKEMTLIPTIDGSYCLSSYQFMVLTLCDLILVKRVFQGMKSDQRSEFMSKFYAMLTNILKQESDFVSYEKFEQTKSFLGNWFSKNFSSLNQNEISNVNKNVFTSEDLKEQLVRLELTEIFPGILDVANYVRMNISINGCSYEATRLMLETVQNSQFAYILNSMPKQLSDIFHERKWCVKLRLESCPHCSEKNYKEPSVRAVEATNTSVEIKAVEEKENLPETIASLSDFSSSDESSESSTTEKSDDSVPDNLPLSSSTETVVVEKQEPVQKQKKMKNKTEKPVAKPEVKESQTCPKCIRASELTVKTNEKLRLSKIEVKHLKKELSEVQLALEKKEERIRILEEKLQEKENQLNLKNSEVQSLDTEKQGLEQRNKRNERLIATFHEVISKKDMAIESLKCHNYEKDKLIKKLKTEESKAIPSRSTEESERVASLLSSLLETKTILSKEAPLEKLSDICDALITNTNSKVTQQLVKYETKVFQLQVSSYVRIVENNIKLIQGNQAIKLDQIPEIPDFPEFSEEFKNVHKLIIKKEAPLLCRQLLKLTDEIADMECVICITDMESHDGTTKCGHCKRRYHNHCIKSWLKTKSICPTCKHGMVDEQEYPTL
ncbi:hypothetical protein CAEBREN_19323 [Caenorhabditis brenneri]|uniref:RING-type domain-containing protein n=1 Tax=Caenorhabditis brenneri TaxID=135651 RepID=G0MT45_CAEBE|nr:hypothetical protein CAEBREN_19323 [Caenorhabditis brenneri]